MPAADERPIEAVEAADLFEPFRSSPSIAVAVSGGPDSVALLKLVADWARAGRGPSVHVFTVDHGLREGSAAEAAGVLEVAAQLGVSARVLTWHGPKPATGIEEAAREARYRLLLDAAREVGANHLLTAHHQDDQAETFLMRLARGSGPFGLAGMRRESPVEGIVLFRPLLDIPKSRLVATARAAGLPFADDPMNADPRFSRARLRRLMPLLAEEGLDGKRLGQAAARMGRVADAVDHYASRLLRERVAVDRFAVGRLDLGAFALEPTEVRLRALVRLLQAFGGGVYPPRQDHLEALDRKLLGSVNGRARSPSVRTLAGTVIDFGAGSEARIYREIGRRTPAPVALANGFVGIWDHRFEVAVEPADFEGLVLAPLGSEAGAALGASGHALPKGAAAALPSVRFGSKILAAPGVEPSLERPIRVAWRSILADRLAAG